MMYLVERFGNVLLISSLLFLTRSKCLANDVLGCNGFIKSNVGDIDFSKVEIKMYTKQGSLKDQTECAPNNGYYFLPLYDKGEYVLKVAPPLGWNFDPAEVTINVDGSTDSCSLGKDINFVLQGFAVTGQVTSLDESIGPVGVTVNLLSVSSKPEVLLTTKTKEGGSFILTPAKPGQYFVEVSHERWLISKKRIAVNVKNGNVEVPDNSLVVAGYDVSGTVTSDSEPIMGVSFVLFQKVNAKRIAVVECESSALTGFSPSNLDLNNLVPICHVSSDEKGHFTFVSLPTGQYTIVPHYKGMHSIKFDVQPQHLTFEVKHGSLQLPTTFQVKGFSVDGQVLWSAKGKPLEGAKVLLDQVVVSQTGPNGVFHLDSMTPGIYKLLIQARDVLFEEQTVKVTPNTPHIGEVIPHAYRVCGRVSTAQGESEGGLAAGGRLLDLESANHHYQATTDPSGEYCVFLPPDTYTVTLPITHEERGTGLQFAPLKRFVQVMDGPVVGVDFSQLRARVAGSFKCLVVPCPEIPVKLQAQAQDHATVLSKDGIYVFENVLPGDYTVSVDSQNWCWQSYEFPLSINSEQIKGPTFVQTGIPIHFTSSHSTKVSYQLVSSNASTLVDIPAGVSSVCVAQPGVYILHPLGCHGYSSPFVRWTSGPVTLTAVSHEYRGSVTSDEIVADLVINVIPSEENAPNPANVRKLGPLVASRGQAGLVVYTFSTQLTPGESVTLVPAASSLLFTPMVAAVVGASDCEAAGAVFHAERGRVLQGRVLGHSRPVPSATITIHDHTGQLIATQLTDNEGHYQFGPLSASINYNVTAEKEGYVLTGPNSQGEFNAHKLAEVIVTVKDKSDGQPLQGVLLSLSGGENYRRNSQTGSDGTMAFLSLSPSEYFLRPMMKEYKFDPPSKMIAVQEGATVKVTLSGERVAYSVVGAVTCLSGDAEPGVVVEAVGQGSQQCSQLQEESTTEATGYFRIRGLQPQCEYSVRVKQGQQVNQHIQRSTPEGILVKVNKEDVHGLNIIVFRPISRTDVSVYVVAETPEQLRSLRVKLFREDATVHSVRLSSLKATPSYALTTMALVFPPVPADGRTYSVQLESSLSQKTHNYKTHPVYFKANSSFQLVRLNFVTTARGSENELSHSSYLALPLVLLVLLAVYHRDMVTTLIARLHSSDAASDDSTADGKRKLKQKKT